MDRDFEYYYTRTNPEREARRRQQLANENRLRRRQAKREAIRSKIVYYIFMLALVFSVLYTGCSVLGWIFQKIWG